MGRSPADTGPVLRDRGRPMPTEILDRKYRTGAFGFLDSLSELGHYMIVAGYVWHFFDAPAILDIGCGHGRLLQVLARSAFRRYLGIDVSAEAIKRAKAQAARHTRFEVADFNAWVPRGRFDVIVFCESLIYAVQPVTTLVRYARALEPGGALVVSMYRHRKPGALWKRTWRNADAYFATVDWTTVSNRDGQTWDIKVLRPKHAGRREPGRP